MFGTTYLRAYRQAGKLQMFQLSAKANPSFGGFTV